MKKKLLLYFIITTLSINCYSQFSKTHYIPPLSKPNSIQIGRQYLYISTPSTTPIDVLIKEVGGTVHAATVSRDLPFEFNVNSQSGPEQLVVDQSSVNSVLSNRGYIIEAEDIVYVSARIDSDDGGASNQAGALVSKGLAALGTQFRVGGFLNLSTNYQSFHYTFLTVMAVENNTTVSFDDIKPGALLINDNASGNMPSNVILNTGESYIIAVQGPNNANRDALIGSLISSDKPIVVNCGSLGGTNAPQNLDYGFDQIVSAERTGKDYIFVKGTGYDVAENVLIIAHEDNTEVFINGSATSTTVLNNGEYIQFNGSFFSSNGNLFVQTSKNTFAYQSVSSENPFTDFRNQEMFFVPPLSCQTPKSIDNIPFIENIGNRTFTGRVTITTKIGSTLSFLVNGSPYNIGNLPGSASVFGPTAVTGNNDYVCYTLTGLTGNVSVFSTSELYLAAYGTEDAATFGGYYSGFTYKPEVTLQQLDVTQSGCIPNTILQISSLSGFDTYQWYFNGNPIPGATSISYQPTNPGYYYLKASLTSCSIVGDLDSDIIPVSNCALDDDNDTINNNIDQDLDNDCIDNCTESFGNQNINLSNTATGSIFVNSGSALIPNYSNSFTGTITTGTTQPPSAIPFAGSSDGTFVSSVPRGLDSFVNYEIQFANPLDITIDYPTTAIAGNLINQNSNFIISALPMQTVTVLNPDNQLLIDTNFDGIFESNVTQFSSFEIRFRVNGGLPLAAGTGTFSFNINNATVINYKQFNLTDDIDNVKATFRMVATCISKDSDNNGIPDKLQFDLPVVTVFETLTQCDDDTDGTSIVNLTQKNDFISANAANETFQYFTTFNAAQTNNSAFEITNPISYSTSNTTIWVKITDSNGCFKIAQLDVIISTTQIPAGTQWTFNECDDYIDDLNDDRDGFTNFNFSQVTTDIQNNILPVTGNYSISYYETETDFLSELNPILDISNFRNVNSPFNQDIWVRVDSTLDNSCYGFGIIHLVVNPLPEILLTGDGFVCLNQPTVFITLDAGIIDGSPTSNYTYQWFLNGTAITNATNYTLDVNTNGIYTVEVTTSFGCSRTRTYTITASEIAILQNINIIDLVDNNSVEVLITGVGVDYFFALDDENNYQTSNFFENVPIGNHTIYIRDNKGCGMLEIEIHIIGAPKYFTPNGDGIQDTWNIRGTSDDYNANAIIYIFDRFGKLLKQIAPLGNGWDGTFNGNIMPADDYWFIAKFSDNRETKGHFTLKR